MVYVAGIGTVELKVQALRETGSPIRTLVLKNVLHVLDAICNGFAFIEYHKFYGGENRRNTSEGLDEEGKPLWCSKLFQGVARRLVLPGKPRSKSYSNYDLQSLDVYIENEDISRNFRRSFRVFRGLRRSWRWLWFRCHLRGCVTI